jgi:hypothetical protein
VATTMPVAAMVAMPPVAPAVPVAITHQRNTGILAHVDAERLLRRRRRLRGTRQSDCHHGCCQCLEHLNPFLVMGLRARAFDVRYDSLSLYSNFGALLSVSRDVSTNAFQSSPSLFTTIVAGSTIT